MEVAPKTLYNELFFKLFKNLLFDLSSHQCGNFVVQSLVFHARTQDQVCSLICCAYIFSLCFLLTKLLILLELSNCTPCELHSLTSIKVCMWNWKQMTLIQMVRAEVCIWCMHVDDHSHVYW